MKATVNYNFSNNATTFSKLAVGDWFLDKDKCLCVKVYQGCCWGFTDRVNACYFDLDDNTFNPLECDGNEEVIPVRVEINVTAI